MQARHADALWWGMTSTTPSTSSSGSSYWLAVWCGFAVLAIGLGVRQSFGIFLKPVSAELHVGRELFSFGTAVSMLLMGLFAPFVGRLADRFGSAPTIAGGAAVYVLGMVTMAMMHGEVMLILGNVLSGVGLAAASFSPVLGAIMRKAPKEKQALALGICSAGGSFGQFFIVPLAAALQHYFGDWRPTMWVLVGLAAVHAAARDRAQRPQPDRRRPQDGRRQAGFGAGDQGGVRPAQLRAARDRLLRLRLPRRLRGRPSAGLHLRQGRRPVAVRRHPFARRAGRLEHRHGRPVQHRRLHPVEHDGQQASAQEPAVAALPAALAGVPGLRAGAAVGLLRPRLRGRAGLPVAGHRAAHQLAGRPDLRAGARHDADRLRLPRPPGRRFIGGWGGGLLFDLTGGYDAMWWISIALGLVSALLHWPIVEKPVARPLLATA